MMDRTTRPLVIVAAFAGSLVVGLVLMLWALGGLRHVAAPAAIGGPFQLTDQSGQAVCLSAVSKTGTRFAIKDEIPNMLIEEAELPPGCASLADLECVKTGKAKLHPDDFVDE